MYTKAKERVFKCIPLYIVFIEILLKFINIRNQISYENNNLIQYMNIINERITNRMIMYD